jgi:hypothetical protein
MTYPNFANLKNIYNHQMDLMLDKTGLTTKCELNYGVTNRQICSNCIYDPGLKKSANKYKTGGPIPFVLGQICPYCYGVGWSGEEKSEIVYLAIIADHKKWINPPPNVILGDNMIQAISKRCYYDKLKQCKDMTVLYSKEGANPKYNLFNDPTPAGLGDSNYIISIWKDL